MSTQKTRNCIGINDIPAHDVPWDEKHLAPWAMDPGRKNIRCRDCDREYRRSRREARSGKPSATTSRSIRSAEIELSKVEFNNAPATTKRELVAFTHDYIPNKELVELWKTIVKNTKERGVPPANIIFFGPSGSGKTRGAEYLANLVKLPFTKVDAASMTDPEAWFGTREVIVEEGVSVTKYIPSAFVTAIQQPGVTFIDEVNRVDDEHRNVLLPLTDGTGQVTNPLTGEVLTRHPHHFIIMAGNRGLQFTGTSAVDPAFTTRALTVEFEYIDEKAEMKVAKDATGCDDDTALVFVKFANETRAKALSDPDFTPISTREVIMACQLAAGGMARDLAAKFAIINSASPEGGASSVRQDLENIWGGVRLTKAEADGAQANGEKKEWMCPIHNKARVVPAGTSSRTGRAYPEFRACPEPGCDNTSDSKKNTSGGKVCGYCGTQNAVGNNTICSNCGSAL